MNKLILAALSLTVAASAWADREVSEIVETSSNPSIDISVDNATIVIDVWDREEVKVEGTLGDDVDDFDFDARGSRSVQIELRQQHEKHWGGWGGGWGPSDTQLTITVPEDSAVSYEAVTGSVSISGLRRGPLSVEMVMGPVDIADVAGNVDVESVNGNVSLKGITGNVEIETVNGSVDLEQIEGGSTEVGSVNGRLTLNTQAPRIEIEAVSGRVALTAGLVEQLEVEVVSSNFEGVLTLDERGELSAETVSGELDFRFRGEVNADVDVDTMSGAIINGLTDDEVISEEYGPGRYLETQVGNGSGNIEASTLSGRISLKYE